MIVESFGHFYQRSPGPPESESVTMFGRELIYVIFSQIAASGGADTFLEIKLPVGFHD